MYAKVESGYVDASRGFIQKLKKQYPKHAGGVRMTNEELAERIYADNTELYSAL